MPKSSCVLQIILLICIIIVIVYVIRSYTDNPAPVVVPAAPKRELYTQQIYRPPKQFILYNFYNLKCPYSIQFDPTWKQLKNQFYNIPNLSFKEIDMSLPENENILFYYKVEASPTIILVTEKEKTEKYVGNRNLEHMKQFLTDRL